MGRYFITKSLSIQIVSIFALAIVAAITMILLADAGSPLDRVQAAVPTGIDVGSGGHDITRIGLSAPLALSPTLPMCRFGYAASTNPPSNYDLGGRLNLRAGWFLDFSNHPPYTATAPELQYAQVVRLHQIKTVYPSYTATYVIPYTYTINSTNPATAIQQLVTTAQLAPGSTWLIGNEIERRDWPCGNGGTCGQDEMLPEAYADAYHQIYTALKGADPTARVAVGSQVEVSPLRLKYMDRMWNAYLAKYGQPMPVDLWNIHPYMLVEHVDWNGAAIPAGLTETQGLMYEDWQNDDLPAFEQQIISFRQWMAGKGQQSKPLIISEFGVLFPVWYQDGHHQYYTITRVNNFMKGAFDYMLTAKDPVLGPAADDNRLVQQWNWYSLDNNPQYFNGALFSYTVGSMTDIGSAWDTYVNDPNSPVGPSLNLKMLSASSIASASGPGPYTATVWLKVSNSGYQNLKAPVTISLTKVGDGTPLGQVVLNSLGGCGNSTTVSLQVTNIDTPSLQVKAEINPLHEPSESDYSDNTIYFTILGRLLFLPLIQR